MAAALLVRTVHSHSRIPCGLYTKAYSSTIMHSACGERRPGRSHSSLCVCFASYILRERGAHTILPGAPRCIRTTQARFNILSAALGTFDARRIEDSNVTEQVGWISGIFYVNIIHACVPIRMSVFAQCTVDGKLYTSSDNK